MRNLCFLSNQENLNARTFCFTCVTLISLVILNQGCRQRITVKPMAVEHIEARGEQDGNVYYLADNGNAYREVVADEKWELIETVFNPQEFKESYVTESGTTFRVAPDTHERFAVLRKLDESFEDLSVGTSGLTELVEPKRLKWGSFTLQSPKAPSIRDYVELRNKIVKGQSGFLDCVIEPSREKSHSGQMSLKCVSPAKTSSMVTCKASLSTPLVYFRSGDDFWYEAYYWVEDNYPLTIMDLECEFVKEHPGIRVRFYDDGYLGVELKALAKPQFHQPKETQVKFPTKCWVAVRVHFLLDNANGKIELWQDGKQILSTRGPTLPFRSAIYNSLEVGISAHSEVNHGATLYMDDMRVSPTEF